MVEWYRFIDEEPANFLFSFINDNSNFPLIGRNAATGKLEPNKQHTLRWCSEVTVCTDNKFGFRRLSPNFLELLDISYEEELTFIEDNNVDIEEFQESWIIGGDGE